MVNIEAIQALNDFEIVEKPRYMGSGHGKYEKLYVALKHLGNDKSIKLPMSILEGKKFQSFRTNVVQQAKKRGIFVKVFIQDGSIYVVTK